MTSAIVRLTNLFRELDLPIYYSRRDDRSHPTYRGAWNYKLAKPDDFQYCRDPRADEWPEAYAPRPVDRIVLKNKPSCFFLTPLEAFLRQAKLGCSDCHEPHGTTAEKQLVRATINETCYECHAEKRGPFLFEHAVGRENCVTCHDPHGSNNDRMLVAKVPMLCQRCHIASRHPATLYDKGEPCGIEANAASAAASPSWPARIAV